MSARTAVLFDLDGCIVDSLPSITRCWSQTLTAFGHPAVTEAEVRPLLGPPSDVIARRFAPDAAVTEIAAIVADYRALSVGATDVPAYDGIPELLAGLHDAGIALAIATSKSIEVAEPLLEHLALRELFASVQGTGIDELGTDKTTVLGRALTQLGPDVSALALVGDRAQDVHGAHAHAISAIGAAWGYAAPGELEAANADMIAAAPADVEPLIRRARAARRA